MTEHSEIKQLISVRVPYSGRYRYGLSHSYGAIARNYPCPYP